MTVPSIRSINFEDEQQEMVKGSVGDVSVAPNAEKSYFDILQ